MGWGTKPLAIPGAVLVTLLPAEATQGLSHRRPRTGEQPAAQRDGVIPRGQGGTQAWHSWAPPGQGFLPCPPCLLALWGRRVSGGPAEGSPGQVLCRPVFSISLSPSFGSCAIIYSRALPPLICKYSGFQESHKSCGLSKRCG